MSTSADKENVCNLSYGKEGASTELVTPKQSGVGPRSGARTAAFSPKVPRLDGTSSRGCSMSPLSAFSTPEATTVSNAPDMATRAGTRAMSPPAIGVRRQPARRAKSDNKSDCPPSMLPASPSSLASEAIVCTQAETMSSVARKTGRAVKERKVRAVKGSPRNLKPTSATKASQAAEGTRQSCRRETRSKKQNLMESSQALRTPQRTTIVKTRHRKATGVSVFATAKTDGFEFEIQPEDDDSNGIQVESSRYTDTTDKGQSEVKATRNSPVFTRTRLREQCTDKRRVRETTVSPAERRELITPSSEIRHTRTREFDGPDIAGRQHVQVPPNIDEIDEQTQAMVTPSTSTSLRLSKFENSEGRRSSMLPTYGDSDEEVIGEGVLTYESGCWRLSDGDQTDLEEDTRQSTGRRGRQSGKVKLTTLRRSGTPRNKSRGKRTSVGTGIVTDGDQGDEGVARESVETRNAPASTATSAPPSSVKRKSTAPRDDGAMPDSKYQELLDALKAHFNKVDSHQLQLSRS